MRVPIPLRVMTPIGEAFIDRCPLRIGNVEVVVAETIIDNVYAWERGRRVEVEEPLKRWKSK